MGYLGALASKLKHQVLAILGISRDSEKHADIYRPLTTLLGEAQPYISIEELREIAAVIDLHMRTEAGLGLRAFRCM